MCQLIDLGDVKHTPTAILGGLLVFDRVDGRGIDAEMEMSTDWKACSPEVHALCCAAVVLGTARSDVAGYSSAHEKTFIPRHKESLVIIY